MPRAAWAVLVALALVVTTAVAVFLWKPAPRHTEATTPTTASTKPSPPGPTAAAPGSPVAGDALSRDLAGLRATRVVSSTTAPTAITGVVATQPDLYAGEFVRRLLTHDYVTPRDDLVAWVQAESAKTTEPLVIGLVPAELHHRVGVHSVTTGQDGSPPPIPTAADWSALAQKRSTTTVEVERVREPVPWANAVLAGRITDAGCTAREVAATVTRHTGDTVERFSVSVALNLEGPPSRSTWGFVKLVQFTSIPMGAS